MKTQFLTIATIFTLALGTVTSSFAADKKITADDNSSTILTNVSKINKIEVHGNVELFVSDGTAEQVKVYNKYYQQNALVQSKDGVLRISSYADQKLVVWVTATDLNAIIAYDNAEVKSFGNLSKINLDVTLNDSSSAKLDLDAYNANITVNNRAKADLAGTVTQYNLVQEQSASVNHSKLVAENASNRINPIAAQPRTELANL